MKQTKKLLDKIESELVGLAFDQNNRNNLSAALFDISLDHANAIIVLLGKPKIIISSAYALVRPMFECFIRAAWLQHCATDKQIENIINKDTFPMKFGPMLQAIEKEKRWSKTLSKIKKTAINNMHSYTHGGMEIIKRRFKGGVLKQVKDEKEISDILMFIALISFLSFCAIIAIAETKDKDDIIEELYKEITTEHLPAK